MQQLLGNSIVVSLEMSIIEDIIKIMGNAVHSKFTHDEIDSVKQRIISRAQAAVEESKRDSKNDVLEEPSE